jgi:hypothetical protein
MPKKGPSSLKINKERPRQKIALLQQDFSMAEKEHTKGKVFYIYFKGTI